MTEVKELTIEDAAGAVYAASQDIWKTIETAAARDAATRAEHRGANELTQQGEATKARHEAATNRHPLTWEVFARPGKRRGHWELGPAFPDGRLDGAAQAAAELEGALVVAPTDGEEDIAQRLSTLVDSAP